MARTGEKATSRFPNRFGTWIAATARDTVEIALHQLGRIRRCNASANGRGRMSAAGSDQIQADHCA